MAKKGPTYRTTKEIVIPAGTVIGDAPFRTVYSTQHGEILIGFDRDTTGSLRFDTKEALRAGVIEEV